MEGAQTHKLGTNPPELHVLVDDGKQISGFEDAVYRMFCDASGGG